ANASDTSRALRLSVGAAWTTAGNADPSASDLVDAVVGPFPNGRFSLKPASGSTVAGVVAGWLLGIFSCDCSTENFEASTVPDCTSTGGRPGAPTCDGLPEPPEPLAPPEPAVLVGGGLSTTAALVAGSELASVLESAPLRSA